MKAFDADVLTLITEGDPACLQKAALIPAVEQAVPIVVAEQLFRGRLNVIRQAQAGKSKISIDRAYYLLEETITDLLQFKMLSYSPNAETLMQSWRKLKIQVSSSDLRIAAICVVQSATLISRN